MQYKSPTPVQCPYNEGISCRYPNQCARCGWNPEVLAKREGKRKEIK